MAAKKRILTACVRLFIERGYNGTTVAEIIKEADVSASSFQNIFRSKDGVLSEFAAFMFAVSSRLRARWLIPAILPQCYMRSRPRFSLR